MSKFNSSKWVELQASAVAQSWFLILSYTRKSDLVVSEVQMILVSHSLWNLSFYHGPLPSPSHPQSLFPFLSASLLLCNSVSFLLPSVASLCHVLSSLFPYLSYHSCCTLPLFLSVLIHPSLVSSITPHPLSPFSLSGSVFLHPWLHGIITVFLSAGHVDAGKSTLMGHLLYLLGNVNKRTMHKYEQESKKAGKASFAYAWVLDETGEERDRYVLSVKLHTNR